MSELARFFREIEALYFGNASARDIEARLGPSSSGTARLEATRVLVRQQRTQAVASMFAMLGAQLDPQQPGLFASLVERFADESVCVGPHPTALAEPFAAFVGQRVAADPLIPPWAGSLATYCATVIVVEQRAERFDRAVDPLTPALAMLSFSSAVPPISARPATFLIARCAEHQRPIRVACGLAEALVVAALTRSMTAAEIRDACRRATLSELELDDALDRLVSWQIASDRAADAFRAVRSSG
jgi:hypothetical protein